MKKLKFLLLGTMTMTMLSCGTPYMAVYDIGLNKVESPANAKQQFGETKVTKFQDKDVDKYRYEDDLINIVWYVSPTKFNFELLNKTQYTIKINWDDISYVNYNGRSGRVVHAGIKYKDVNNPQPAISIPKGASISDMLLPTESVSLQGGLYSLNWNEANLIPSFYKSKKDMKAEAASYVGKTLQIMMPIMIQNVQNDYIFEFNVDKWVNDK